jgi:hypothetical protein
LERGAKTMHFWCNDTQKSAQSAHTRAPPFTLLAPFAPVQNPADNFVLVQSPHNQFAKSLTGCVWLLLVMFGYPLGAKTVQPQPAENFTARNFVKTTAETLNKHCNLIRNLPNAF